MRIGGLTAHRERVGERESLDQTLQRPVIFVHKLPREVIEQLGMCRPISERAEIVYARDEAATKYMMPNSIDNGTGDVGVLRIDQLQRQFVAPTRFHSCDWFRAGER